MGERNDAIAVFLPADPVHALAFLELAAAVASPSSDAAPARVLAFPPLVGADSIRHEPVRQLAARLGVELCIAERGWSDAFTRMGDEDVGLLVLDWDSWAAGHGDAPDRPDAANREVGERFAQQVPRDIAIVKRAAPPQAVRQILLPVRGGPQGVLTLRLAMGLAEHHDARITLLHVEQPGLLPEDDATVRAQLDVLLERGAHPARAQSAIVIADSVEAAIAVEAEAHQITIMGASPGDPGTPLLLGPVAEAVAAQVSGTLIIVKARE